MTHDMLRKIPAMSTPDAPSQLGDRAYEILRRLIISCELLPGSSVSEPTLCERIGMTKAAVRAALHRLRQEGLLTPVRREGYHDSPVTLEDAQEILDLRLLLEPHTSLRAAGHVQTEQFVHIREQFRAGYDPLQPATMSAFLMANRIFRMAIADASGNVRLAAMIATL